MYYATYLSQFHFLTYLQCIGIHVEYLVSHNFFLSYILVYISFYTSETTCTYLVTSQKKPTIHQIIMVIHFYV